MTKYIDFEKLKAEIERLKDKGKYHEEYDCAWRDGNNNACCAILSFIESVEKEPEVDLEKSKNLIRDTLNGVTRLGSLCDDQTIEHAVDNLIDKLGLNARKEE